MWLLRLKFILNNSQLLSKSVICCPQAQSHCFYGFWNLLIKMCANKQCGHSETLLVSTIVILVSLLRYILIAGV